MYSRRKCSNKIKLLNLKHQQNFDIYCQMMNTCALLQGCTLYNVHRTYFESVCLQTFSLWIYLVLMLSNLNIDSYFVQIFFYSEILSFFLNISKEFEKKFKCSSVLIEFYFENQWKHILSPIFTLIFKYSYDLPETVHFVLL